MNIALVCPYDYFSPGGVQSHIRDSAAELRRLGHHVIVFAPDTGKYPDNIKDVVFIGKSKKINFNQTTFDFTIIGSNRFWKPKSLTSFISIPSGHHFTHYRSCTTRTALISVHFMTHHLITLQAGLQKSCFAVSAMCFSDTLT